MKARKGKADTKKRSSSPGMSIRRFCVTYALLMGAFFFVIGFTPIQRVVDLNGWYTRGVVTATVAVLKALNIPGSSEGSVIRLPAIALDVKFGCNGLEAVMIYSVAVVAFPAAWKKKIIAIAAGFLVIQVVNIARISGLAYVGVRFPGLFEYVHIYIAQGMMIAVALGIFFLYLPYAGKRDSEPA